MQRLPFFLAVLFLILSVSCQKEISMQVLNPGTGTGSGTGTGGGTGSNSNSYNPLNPGSWWKFKDSASGTTSTSTITATQKTRFGILFSAYDPGSNPDTGWAASPAPNYYTAAKGNSPNTGAPYDILFHFLNDTASVGYNWQYVAGQGNGFTAHMKTTIIEKGITMTVEGKTYNNVIHTQQELIYDLFGTMTPSGTYDWFVAKGVGIIKSRAEVGLFGVGAKACSDLVDYSIK